MSTTDLPEGWIKKPFSGAVKRFQSKGGKLKTPGYQERGPLPVVDQGQSLVVAYYADESRAFQGPYPVIVFGDHTRNVKLIDFKFAVGADGVVLLRPMDETELDCSFLYHWLKYVPLHNLGYSRHFKLLKEEEISFPEDLNEQRRIVARIAALTGRAEEARKLRQDAVATINHLFRTELERIFLPIKTNHWTEYDARDVFDIVKGQVDPREEPYASMLHVAPDAIEIGTGKLLTDKIKTAAGLEMKSGKYHFEGHHVLYSKIRPNLRKVALPSFEGTCSADMYPLIPNPEVVTREFLALVLLSPPFTAYAVENSDRNAMPKINRPTMFGYRVKLPELCVQREVVGGIRGIQDKAEEISRLQLCADRELESFQSALLAKAFRGEM
jgi:type I restriction enzyme S subunit